MTSTRFAPLLWPASNPESYSLILESGADQPAIDFVAIPSGSFLMGSPDDEPDRYPDEGPQHEVALEAFHLSRTPITQAQWRIVASWPMVELELNPDPSYFKGDNRPVEQVSWYDAMEFCARLSRYTYQTYTLPSEAQWEYACRAGTTTPFAFGDTLTPEMAQFNTDQTCDVGSFPQNTWGLQDMHGNVWEWCLDNWHESYDGAPTDGGPWLEDYSLGKPISHCAVDHGSTIPSSVARPTATGTTRTTATSSSVSASAASPRANSLPLTLPMQPTQPGRFIVLEGVDGSGKTTQARAIAEWLPSSGLMPPEAQVVLTREPGATPVGQQIREMLLHGSDDLCPTAELLLFAADRAQHVATVIKPALERGDWVVCDRFTGSTVAYQGYGRGHDLELINQINHISTQGVEPDLVLWLCLDLRLAAERCKGLDRFEAQDPDFMYRVEQGYSTVSARNSSWKVIDARWNVIDIQRECFGVIFSKFLKLQP